MKRSFFLLLCIGIFSTGFAQTFSVEQTQSDFKFLRRMLEEAHPGMYWYTPKDSMGRAFEQVFQQLNRPLTEKELFYLWGPLITKIHCGHTYLIHSQQFDAQKDDTFRLPFYSQIIDNQLFVKALSS